MPAQGLTAMHGDARHGLTVYPLTWKPSTDCAVIKGRELWEGDLQEFRQINPNHAKSHQDHTQIILK
jgi:hypothetical protein